MKFLIFLNQIFFLNIIQITGNLEIGLELVQALLAGFGIIKNKE